jgi:hypothetical protein
MTTTDATALAGRVSYGRCGSLSAAAILRTRALQTRARANVEPATAVCEAA